MKQTIKNSDEYGEYLVFEGTHEVGKSTMCPPFPMKTIMCSTECGTATVMAIGLPG